MNGIDRAVMKKLLIPLSILAIGIATAVATLVFRDRNSSSLGEQPELKAQRPNEHSPIGRVLDTRGAVNLRAPKEFQFRLAHQGNPLLSQELIVTDRASEVRLHLITETVLKVHERSRLVIEHDVTREGALIATVLDGQVSIEKPGKAELFRLFRDGRELNLNELTQLETPNLSLPTASKWPADSRFENLVIATLPDETAAPVEQPSPSTRSNENSGAPPSSATLTDEDIVRELKRQSPFFRRCYMSFISRSKNQSEKTSQSSNTHQEYPPHSGSIIVGFNIQPTGRVTDTRIVKSDFVDATLNKCILQTVERTQFKAFDAEAIPVMEFPITLK